MRSLVIGPFVVLTLAALTGCALVGPTCVARQERGSVASVRGEVGAGAVAWHLMPYDPRGSQNDVHVAWGDQQLPTGPRLRVYATLASCTSFQPALDSAATGECAVLASAGWTPVGIASTLVVTHGRGNPERLGSPPQYKVWIVGDESLSARYELDVTFFFGPDC